VKIGAVDTEIALLIVKKKEINASKIYIPVGNLAERAKKYLLWNGTYLARLANSPTGLYILPMCFFLYF